MLVGTRLQPFHVMACVTILAGVSMALLGRGTRSIHVTGSRAAGLCFAFVAGAGQGTGATLSRWAHVAENLQGVVLASHAETLLRVLPGFVVVAVFWWWARSFHSSAPWAVEKPVAWKASAWVSANALCGAIIGVTCFQHALLHASSAVVLSVTATTPIIVMPMTAYSEGDVPNAKNLLGAAIAVTGVVLLKLSA
jgi:drug/metabolite transporter (DMT)-like permease